MYWLSMATFRTTSEGVCDCVISNVLFSTAKADFGVARLDPS